VVRFIQLTMKDQPFSWEVEAFNAFQSLKASLMTSPILDSCRPFQTFCFGNRRFRLCNRHCTLTTWRRYFFHPISFYFRKFSRAEINYNIHDKELLTIVDAFEE
jgi:hypothetical protein